MDNGPDWVILLMYWSHDMRHTGFRRLTMVNETPEIGASHEKCILDSLKDGRSGRSKYGFIVSSCRDLLSLEESFSVQFARRQANVLAHALARTSCQFLSSHSWISLVVQFTWLLSTTCFSINIYIYTHIHI